MKHVVIRPNDEIGGMEIIVDGTNVSRWVADTGVVIEFHRGQAHVTLPVRPVMFSGVFPEAVVNALGGPEGPKLSWEETRTVVAALRWIADFGGRAFRRPEDELLTRLTSEVDRAYASGLTDSTVTR